MNCPRCQAENREGRRFRAGGSSLAVPATRMLGEMEFWLEKAEAELKALG
jgi:hypothetical protein